MSRRSLAFGFLAAATALSVVATTASAGPPEEPDHLRAYSVIPPGQDVGAHTSDQLDMYASLVDDDDVQDDELLDYFHSFQFGPGETIEREYNPAGRTDVTIYRDDFGIPHVYADSDSAAGFALGYATAEDRLWHMDVLRHAGAGRLASFLGDGYVEYDKLTRRDGYSYGEIRKMFESLDDRFGSEGALVQEMVRAYADGVNARMAEVRANPNSLMPPEYFIRRIELKDWEPADTAAASILQLRSFGGSGGDEMQNATALRSLQKSLGNAVGKTVWNDLFATNDPDAYTSIPASEGAFPSQDFGPVDNRSIAIPDNVARVNNKMEAAARVTRRTLRALRVGSPSSNLLAVAPTKAAGGKTLQWGGPQVGYSVPQFFLEVDVHSPSYSFRGPSLPGASVLVPLGRGSDYAWSLTTGASDVVDTRVEKLCHPKGGTVRKGSKYYRFKGKCRRMAGRTETIQIKGSSATDFTSTKYKVFRTVHGPVVARGKVKGRPVAITQQRAYWKKELNFVVALSRINSRSMDSVQEFDAALALAPLSFNAVYSDSTDIGLWHVGHYPARAQGIDPRLPTWGTGKWEWKGTRPWATNPHVINPEQGWITNWNNKPSVGWNNADHSAWGPTQRVRLLSDQIEALLEGNNATMELADVVNVMRTAATQDGNAVLLGGPRVLPQIAPEGVTETAAAAVLAAWIEDGAHRQDRDRDQNQDHAAAVALWDTLYDNLVHNIFDDELEGSYGTIRIPIADDAPHSNGSSYFYDFSNLVWNLLDDSTASKLQRDYCDDLSTPAIENCATQVQAAFDDAVAELVAEQGDDLLAWTWPADYINFSAVGAPSVPAIPWQNRGTYNHAVEVTGSR